MTPKEYLREVVLPNIDEFRTNYSSIRHAYNAITAIDSLAAHIYFWCVTNAPSDVAGMGSDSEYRLRLGERSEDFQLLCDMAKALKHVTLTRGSPEVAFASQIGARSLGWGEARWGESRWGGPTQVVVSTNDGDIRVVEAIVDTAMAFLEQEMQYLETN